LYPGGGQTAFGDGIGTAFFLASAIGEVGKIPKALISISANTLRNLFCCTA